MATQYGVNDNRETEKLEASIMYYWKKLQLGKLTAEDLVVLTNDIAWAHMELSQNADLYTAVSLCDTSIETIG